MAEQHERVTAVRLKYIIESDEAMAALDKLQEKARAVRAEVQARPMPGGSAPAGQAHAAAEAAAGGGAGTSGGVAEAQAGGGEDQMGLFDQLRGSWAGMAAQAGLAVYAITKLTNAMSVLGNETLTTSGKMDAAIRQIPVVGDLYASSINLDREIQGFAGYERETGRMARSRQLQDTIGDIRRGRDDQIFGLETRRLDADLQAGVARGMADYTRRDIAGLKATAFFAGNADPFDPELMDPRMRQANRMAEQARLGREAVGTQVERQEGRVAQMRRELTAASAAVNPSAELQDLLRQDPLTQQRLLAGDPGSGRGPVTAALFPQLKVGEQLIDEQTSLGRTGRWGLRRLFPQADMALDQTEVGSMEREKGVSNIEALPEAKRLELARELNKYHADLEDKQKAINRLKEEETRLNDLKIQQAKAEGAEREAAIAKQRAEFEKLREDEMRLTGAAAQWGNMGALQKININQAIDRAKDVGFENITGEERGLLLGNEATRKWASKLARKSGEDDPLFKRAITETGQEQLEDVRAKRIEAQANIEVKVELDKSQLAEAFAETMRGFVDEIKELTITLADVNEQRAKIGAIMQQGN